MYETYFNLTEKPFASVPRIDHYYPGSVIDAARSTLTRCTERGEGVALLVGPSGTGKSLLCQVLAVQFQNAFQVALLASTHLDTRRSLLQAILYELNRPYRGMDEGELRLSLVDYITLNDDCAHGVLLLVDEAHHLPLRLLDEIRSLTNLTRDRQPAVRIVLAGSHMLEERFASPKLDSFSQRISARCYLEAFQRSETEAYIQTRISASHGRGADLFPAETCQMIHKATDGVPRLINQVCDHVLLLAYAAGIRRIEPAHVEEAWADLQQLPTPWNASAEPSGEGVIEFGGLDDSPSETPSIAGKITAAEEASPVEDADAAEIPVVQPTLVAETTEDPETLEQLRHIQQLLADVQTEFQPVAPTGPEVELVFETPHPFAEPFEEEEVIADRFVAATARQAPSSSTAEPSQTNTAVAVAGLANNAEPVRAGESCESTGAERISVHLQHVAKPDMHRDERLAETIPLSHDCRFVCGDPSESEVAAAAATDEPLARHVRSVVPPPRREFSRLFAKLRRGL
jgi:type II secretory pathway predicted ATPase ExeA